MLERIINKIKGIKPIAQSARCVWKTIYLNALKNPNWIGDLEQNYKMKIEECAICDGYKKEKPCYYIKK